jgi:NCS1 family nucleobase:cation symporter-1
LACLGTFAWCINYGGGVHAGSLVVKQVHGGALGWAMLNGINSCLGVTSALLVNVGRLTSPFPPSHFLC